MFTIRFIAILSALMFVLAGCASVKVHSISDGEASLAAIETYAWAEPASPDAASASDAPQQAPPLPGAPVQDGRLALQIETTVDSDLAARGLRKVSPDEADVLLAQRTSVQVKPLEKDTEYSFYSVELYEEGTLTIEFTEAQTRQSLWQGTGQRRLRTVGGGSGVGPPRYFDAATLEPREWRIEQMVDAILAKYPVRERTTASAAAR